MLYRAFPQKNNQDDEKMNIILRNMYIFPV